MKKFLTFSLFVILALVLVFAMTPTIGAGPPDVKDSGMYALNQPIGDLTLTLATGGVNGGPNTEILATATLTLMNKVPLNELYATSTARPDPGVSQRANYSLNRTNKSPWNIASMVIANRPYPMRT